MSFKPLCLKHISDEAKEYIIFFFPNLKDFATQCFEKEWSKHHCNIDRFVYSFTAGSSYDAGLLPLFITLAIFRSTSKVANVVFTFRPYATVAMPCKLQEVVSFSRNKVFHGSYAFLRTCTLIFYIIIIIIIILKYIITTDDLLVWYVLTSPVIRVNNHNIIGLFNNT